MSALCPSQQPTVLFSIYQNNFWTIRRLVYETIDPVTQPILLKIVGYLLGKIRANLIYITLQPDTKTFTWFEHPWVYCLLLKGFWIHFTNFLEPKSIIAKFRIKGNQPWMRNKTSATYLLFWKFFLCQIKVFKKERNKRKVWWHWFSLLRKRQSYLGSICTLYIT